MIVNDWKPLTNITKSSILDDAAVLDPPQIVFIFGVSKCHYHVKSQKIYQHEYFCGLFSRSYIHINIYPPEVVPALFQNLEKVP